MVFLNSTEYTLHLLMVSSTVLNSPTVPTGGIAHSTEHPPQSTAIIRNLFDTHSIYLFFRYQENDPSEKDSGENKRENNTNVPY